MHFFQKTFTPFYSLILGTRLTELWGFAAEPGSFQQIFGDVKNRKTGWTKDMRKAHSFHESSISKYILGAGMGRVQVLVLCTST